MTVAIEWKLWPFLILCLLALGGGNARAETAEQCLARTLYFEARGDGTESMAAVAAVVMNRVRDTDFPDNPCAVVKQGGEKPPCQFSYWCDGKSDRPTDKEQWRRARSIARKALKGDLENPVGGALYFHDDSVKAPFHDKRQYVKTVGSLRFYR
ncbi:MAG TPA: cell wall hydrolase [Gammaproteobacteria bacterium]|nr:cell wall hydrolase [Gammaproteobacteria bacterium]